MGYINYHMIVIIVLVPGEIMMSLENIYILLFHIISPPTLLGILNIYPPHVNINNHTTCVASSSHTQIHMLVHNQSRPTLSTLPPHSHTAITPSHTHHILTQSYAYTQTHILSIYMLDIDKLLDTFAYIYLLTHFNFV